MCHGRDVTFLDGFMHVYTADFEVSTSGWQWRGSHTPHPGECCWSGGRYTSWLESQQIQEICIIVGFIKIFFDLASIFESEKKPARKKNPPISNQQPWKKEIFLAMKTWFWKILGAFRFALQPQQTRARTHNDDKDTIDEASSAATGIWDICHAANSHLFIPNKPPSNLTFKVLAVIVVYILFPSMIAASKMGVFHQNQAYNENTGEQITQKSYTSTFFDHPKTRSMSSPRTLHRSGWKIHLKPSNHFVQEWHDHLYMYTFAWQKRHLWNRTNE